METTHTGPSGRTNIQGSEPASTNFSALRVDTVDGESPPFNFDLSNRGEPETIDLGDGRYEQRWQDGTVMVYVKERDYHYQTIRRPIESMDDWLRLKKNHLDPDDPTRYLADWCQYAAECKDRDFAIQLTHRGVYGFARIWSAMNSLPTSFMMIRNSSTRLWMNIQTWSL